MSNQRVTFFDTALRDGAPTQGVDFDPAEGNGPVKVRILTPSGGTGAIVPVMIESKGRDGERWATVGVSANIIDASFRALHDSPVYCLMKAGYSVNSPMRHAGRA